MMNIQEIKLVGYKYGVHFANYTMLDGSVVIAPTNFTPMPDYKCGPNKNKLLTLIIPDKVYFNRKPACKVHDWMYTYPCEGLDDYKRAADALFKINMGLLAQQQSNTKAGVYLAAPFNWMFYKFVHWFGKSSFYSDKLGV